MPSHRLRHDVVIGGIKRVVQAPIPLANPAPDTTGRPHQPYVLIAAARILRLRGF